MISSTLKNLVRYTLSLGASTYLDPHNMSKAPEQTKQELASIGLSKEDLLGLTTTEASLIGFTLWSEDDPSLYLIPAWLYPALPVGLQVTGISGEVSEFSPETHDSESRYGCLAYGIHLVESDLAKL